MTSTSPPEDRPLFILYGVLIGLVAGFLARGHLSGITALHLRWAPIALGGLAFQIVLFSEPVTERIGSLGPPLYVASTLAVLVVVIRNWSITGLPLVAIGALCNLAAIIANGGYMPTTTEALGALGAGDITTYSNSAILVSARLSFLSDILVMPPWIPLANVFSLGDVLIGLGTAIAIAAAMRSARTPDPAGPDAPGGAVADVPAGADAGAVAGSGAGVTAGRGSMHRSSAMVMPALALVVVIAYFALAFEAAGS
jgi:hypothetical protein